MDLEAMSKEYLIKKLNLNEKEVISFVGGGGKTTVIEMLAVELKNEGRTVLSTTSTAIFKPKKGYDAIFIGDMPYGYIPRKNSITVYGEYETDGKLKVSNISKIDDLINMDIFDYILIEADGSRGKPIKAPLSHEPVVSNLTTITVGMIGIDCLGQRICDIAHRQEIMADVLKTSIYHIIEYNDIVKLSIHKDGVFKGAKGRKILFLNKVDDSKLGVVEKIELELKDTAIEVVIGKSFLMNLPLKP
ncbi:selenium cofactor biosynthesis protein YqeC [Paratissierella segnis]|uniref:Selenium-dependent hydroxylase accessory protein YqeC n=1 Tax=Paratissierella segnis TaxID=2763679 RepID=A0A926EVV5_9FIRM|nr:selenium cofactor biosynthesis protein YqeC [Paratissierella segnis]MBC8587185.1 putative selenium-dependent hydroxylase accessory protein YqeC [Paratissierella segnis]